MPCFTAAQGVCSAIYTGNEQGDTYYGLNQPSMLAQYAGVHEADLNAANPQLADPYIIRSGETINIPPCDVLPGEYQR